MSALSSPAVIMPEALEDRLQCGRRVERCRRGVHLKVPVDGSISIDRISMGCIEGGEGEAFRIG